MLRGFRIKLGAGLLLDVPAKEPRDEILGKSQRWGRPKRRAPQGAKLIEAERPHAVNLSHQLGPALKLTQNCELRGVVTGSPEKGAAWAKEYRFPVKNIYHYDTMARLAENPDIDIVYVVTRLRSSWGICIGPFEENQIIPNLLYWQSFLSAFL